MLEDLLSLVSIGEQLSHFLFCFTCCFLGALEGLSQWGKEIDNTESQWLVSLFSRTGHIVGISRKGS